MVSVGDGMDNRNVLETGHEHAEHYNGLKDMTLGWPVPKGSQDMVGCRTASGSSPQGRHGCAPSITSTHPTAPAAPSGHSITENGTVFGVLFFFEGVFKFPMSCFSVFVFMFQFQILKAV